MFDSFGTMPIHPLAIHAPVIGIPLVFLLALLFAYPRTRQWARWPLALAAVGSAGAVFVARQSGSALEQALGIGPADPRLALLGRHAGLADQLQIIILAVAALAVGCAVLVRRRPAAASAGTSAGDQQRRRRPVDLLLPLLTVAVAGLALVWVVRVGDLGARAVWNPLGTVDYSVGR